MKKNSIGRTAGAAFVGLWLVAAGCVGGGSGGHTDIFEDLAMLASLSDADYSGNSWTLGPPSVAANLISSSPELHSQFLRINPFCYGYTTVSSFDSEEGLSPITFMSSLQNATATYNGSRYVFSGLMGGPAFAMSNDMLSISAMGANGTITESIASPPQPTNGNDVFGMPAGFDTSFSAQDGTFDLMYTFVRLTGSGSNAGVSCSIPAEEMQLDGSVRSAPILHAGAKAWITESNLTVADIYVSMMREKKVTGFFERETSLQAGQMFRINPLSLGF